MLPVRVYFEDTDFSGVVYHATYLRWCERGRSDFLRLLGVGPDSLFNGPLTGERCAFAVRRIVADYLRPARIDDLLEVHTAVAEVSKASIVLSQSVLREASTFFRLQAQCVLISHAGRVLRFPHRLSKLLETAPGGSAGGT